MQSRGREGELTAGEGVGGGVSDDAQDGLAAGVAVQQTVLVLLKLACDVLATVH